MLAFHARIPATVFITLVYFLSPSCRQATVMQNCIVVITPRIMNMLFVQGHNYDSNSFHHIGVLSITAAELQLSKNCATAG